MLDLTLPDLAVIAAVAFIVLGFTILGFVKGLVRMFFGLVALSAGLIAACWGFQRGGSIAGTVVSSPEPWMSGAVGVVLGLAVFFVARALFSVVSSPFAAKSGNGSSGFFGGVLGFLMGAAATAFLFSGVRYLGTLDELDWIKTSVRDKGKITKSGQPPLARVKRLVDSTAVGQLHEQYDVLNNRARANLAKLTVLVDNKIAVTTAATHKPVRDAVLQEDINAMLKEQSADLRSYIEERQYAHLLKAKPIREVARKPNAEVALKAIDVEQSLGLLEEEKK